MCRANIIMCDNGPPNDQRFLDITPFPFKGRACACRLYPSVVHPACYFGCVFHLVGGVCPFMPTHTFYGLVAVSLLLLRRVSSLALMRV